MLFPLLVGGNQNRARKSDKEKEKMTHVRKEEMTEAENKRVIKSAAVKADQSVADDDHDEGHRSKCSLKHFDLSRQEKHRCEQ